jgi:hypothetical protein
MAYGSSQNPFRLGVVIREYSRQPDGTFAITGTDATILPENFQHPEIHPFALTGISSVIPYRQGFPYPPNTIRHHWYAFTLERCFDPAFRLEVDAAQRLADGGTGAAASSVKIDRYLRVGEVSPLSFIPEPNKPEQRQENFGRGHNLKFCDNGWLMMNSGARSAGLMGFL